jgi:hypothetical protein
MDTKQLTLSTLSIRVDDDALCEQNNNQKSTKIEQRHIIANKWRCEFTVSVSANPQQPFVPFAKTRDGASHANTIEIARRKTKTSFELSCGSQCVATICPTNETCVEIQTDNNEIVCDEKKKNKTIFKNRSRDRDANPRRVTCESSCSRVSLFACERQIQQETNSTASIRSTINETKSMTKGKRKSTVSSTR